MSNTPSEELYWRLHSLSKILEGSGFIDESQHPDAYATILDAMDFVRSTPQPVAREPLSDDVVKDAMRYRWLRDKNSHYLHNRAWLASVTAVKDGPCDIFSADEVAALLDAEIDRRSVAARKQGANHD